MTKDLLNEIQSSIYTHVLNSPKVATNPNPKSLLKTKEIWCHSYASEAQEVEACANPSLEG